MSEPKILRIDYTRVAEKYRLQQAEELLAEAGFIRRADGTWSPPV